MSYQIRTLSAISQVDAAAWNACLTEHDAPTSRWEWLAAMEQSGSATPRHGWQANHFSLWQDDVLLAAAPAYIKNHSFGEYIYDFAWAGAAEQVRVPYYPKLVVCSPLAPLTTRKLVFGPSANAALVNEKFHEWLAKEQTEVATSHLLFLTASESAELPMPGMIARTTLQFHWQNPGYRTYEEFLARFDSKRRNQLKRERGEAAKQGVTIVTKPGTQLGPNDAEFAYQLYEATVTKFRWGQLQLTPAFFSMVFATMKEYVELVIAERNGERVAGAFNLVGAHRLYGRYWGCLEEIPFLHFHVCLYHSIDSCIARGLSVFEPGAGGEHKITRGFVPCPIYSLHHIAHPALAKLIDRACSQERKENAQVIAEGETIAGMKPFLA